MKAGGGGAASVGPSYDECERGKIAHDGEANLQGHVLHFAWPKSPVPAPEPLIGRSMWVLRAVSRRELLSGGGGPPPWEITPVLRHCTSVLSPQTPRGPSVLGIGRHKTSFAPRLLLSM